MYAIRSYYVVDYCYAHASDAERRRCDSYLASLNPGRITSYNVCYTKLLREAGFAGAAGVFAVAVGDVADGDITAARTAGVSTISGADTAA